MSTSDTTIAIAKDVVEMLLLPEIMVALNFERETGLYFEVTSKWHSSPGQLSARPGFRMFEIHSLWFEFISPWWEAVKANPSSRFSITMKAIEKINNLELRNKKSQQVIAGINAAYNTLINLSNCDEDCDR